MNQEKYEKLTHDLFQDWEEKNISKGFQKISFLKDGIINYKKRSKKEVKILFLNKKFSYEHLLEKHPDL